MILLLNLKFLSVAMRECRAKRSVVVVLRVVVLLAYLEPASMKSNYLPKQYY